MMAPHPERVLEAVASPCKQSVFHHDGNSILLLWLMMFITHAVFHCFLRNLQPVLRLAHTAVHFAELIAADLLRDHWWPPHPT